MSKTVKGRSAAAQKRHDEKVRLRKMVSALPEAEKRRQNLSAINAIRNGRPVVEDK